MSQPINFYPTVCAVCRRAEKSTELYPANFTLDSFNPEVFSARRLPDKIHYRIVKCDRCGLVRSDPIVSAQSLTALYKQSHFDYTEEVNYLKSTYKRTLMKLDNFGAKKGSLLEIGCGNGFFLEEALKTGYQAVRGVEPSGDAIRKAPPQIRPHIVCDVLRPGLFSPDTFDVICLFQVLDHIPEPNSFLAECFSLLKPGGFVLCLQHNVNAVSAKLLKGRSPIIDIEHTYLYSPKTLSALFFKSGFVTKKTGSAFNTNSLGYLTKLAPLPSSIKRILLKIMQNTILGNLRISLPIGNLYLIAQKK